MNEEICEKTKKRTVVKSAKECAYLAVFVALVIAGQLLLSAVPGVEIVTVMFVAYSFVFGVRRSMLAATAFSLLRQFVFGAYPVVLVLYLLYFNGLAAAFGGLGHCVKKPLKYLWALVLLACVCTASFTMIDNLLTPLWYGYSARVTRMYFTASLPIMFPQIFCTAVSVGVLFVPLQKTFHLAKKGLR